MVNTVRTKNNPFDLILNLCDTQNGTSCQEGLWASLKPKRTIKEIVASDLESMPSAVATTLPLTKPVVSSTIPIAINVITEIFAILCPATMPSSKRLVW